MAVLSEAGLAHVWSHVLLQLKEMKTNACIGPKKIVGNPVIFEDGIETFRINAKINNDFVKPSEDSSVNDDLGIEIPIANWPTPDDPADCPIQMTNYLLYHSSNRNLFQKSALVYSTTVTNVATFVIPLSENAPLYIKAFNVPDTLEVVVQWRFPLGDGTYDYGGFETLTTGSSCTICGGSDTGAGFADSMRLYITKLDETELTTDDVNSLEITVSFDGYMDAFEDGQGFNCYNFEIDDSWDSGVRCFGIVDLNKGIIESNYGYVSFFDLADDTVTWTQSTITGPIGEVMGTYWYTNNITLENYTDIFCTHYAFGLESNNGISYSNGVLTIYDSNNFTTADEFKTFIRNLDGMIIYKRSEPLIYNITVPNIYCYEGSNYLYTDGNELEVIYNVPGATYKSGSTLPDTGVEGDIFFLYV